MTIKFSPLVSLRYFILAALSVFFISAGITVHRTLAGKRQYVSIKEASEQAQLVRVKTVTAEDVRLTVTGFGRVRPARSVRISPEVSGRVVKVNPWLKAGEFVSEGEVLLEIDDESYKLAEKFSAAQLDSASAQLEHLVQEEKNLSRQVEVVKENADLAQTIYRRTLKLFEQSTASETQRDEARQSYLQLLSQLVDLQNRKALLPAQISEAQANIRSREVSLEEARLNLRRTVVHAPFAARVQSAVAEVGLTVNPATELAVLEDSAFSEVPVMIPETGLTALLSESAGESHFLHIDLALRAVRSFIRDPAGPAGRFRLRERRLDAIVSYSDGTRQYRRSGRVVRLEPIVEKDRTVPVIVAIENPWQNESAFENGKFVAATIYGRTLTGVFIVPRTAIREESAVNLLRDGRLQVKEVRIRHRREEDVIVDGLAAGDAVVLTNLPSPVPGMALRALEVKP